MTDALLERAQQLIQWQRYNDAEKELRQVLAVEPERVEALALLAICQAEQKNTDLAIETIQNAIGLQPDNDYLLYLQSLFYLRQEKIKEAEKFIRNAIAIQPHKAEYFGLLAAICLNRKEWQLAVDNANAGLAIDPENLQCLNARAQALYKLDKKEDAYKTIQEALNKDPENEYTHTNLGWSLLEKGDHRQALVHFREALKINPSYAYAKAGMVEGLKSRYWFYRMFLRYAFWIGNLKGKAQWAILLGMYFGIRFLDNVASNNPSLAVILNPIIYLYFAFAISTWIITPLSNLFLRLNVYGRYALTRDEVRASAFVGVALLIGVAAMVTWLVNGHQWFLLVGIYGLSMMIPLGSMFTARSPRSKGILIGYTAALAVVGLAALIMPFFNVEIANTILTVYTIGILAYQWIVNALLTR